MTRSLTPVPGWRSRRISFSAALAESASLSPFIHPATQASASGQRENHEKYSAGVLFPG
jgi:hypothetical protein